MASAAQHVTALNLIWGRARVGHSRPEPRQSTTDNQFKAKHFSTSLSFINKHHL